MKELKNLLEEAEKKLLGLKSVKKIENAVKKDDAAYQERAEFILRTMSEHLQKLKSLMDNLDKE